MAEVTSSCRPASPPYHRCLLHWCGEPPRWAGLAPPRLLRNSAVHLLLQSVTRLHGVLDRVGPQLWRGDGTEIGWALARCTGHQIGNDPVSVGPLRNTSANGRSAVSNPPQSTFIAPQMAVKILLIALISRMSSPVLSQQASSPDAVATNAGRKYQGEHYCILAHFELFHVLLETAECRGTRLLIFLDFCVELLSGAACSAAKHLLNLSAGGLIILIMNNECEFRNH